MSGKYFIIGGAALIIALIAVLSLVNVFGSGTTSGVAGTTTNNLGTDNPSSTGATNTATNTAASTGVQDVKLSVVGGNYILEPSTLKKGVPVRMTADLGSVVGCSRDIVIQSFGVRKYVKPGDNIIQFTPDKTGVINIACSMNMYRGTFQVTDDGKPSASLQTLSPANTQTSPGGTCGVGGGGCGCGRAS